MNDAPKKKSSILRMKISGAMLFLIVVTCIFIASLLTPIFWKTYTEMLFFDVISLYDGSVIFHWESKEQKVANPPVRDVFSLMPDDPMPIDLLFLRLERGKWISHPAPTPPTISNYEIGTSYDLQIRMLSLILLSGAWLIFSVIRPNWVRKFRIRRGLCSKCGYNLKGNTTGICSECGTPINPTK